MADCFDLRGGKACADQEEGQREADFAGGGERRKDVRTGEELRVGDRGEHEQKDEPGDLDLCASMLPGSGAE